MIIGFTGHTSSGKTTAATYVGGKYGGYFTSLGSSIRKMALEFRDAGEAGGYYDYETDARFHETVSSLRYVWLKDFGDHLHLCNQWEKRFLNNPHYEGGDLFLIDDITTQAEAAWLRALGGKVVRVYRPDVDFGVDLSDPTPQDAEISEIEGDGVVWNDGSLADFHSSIDAMCEMYGLQPLPKKEEAYTDTATGAYLYASALNQAGLYAQQSAAPLAAATGNLLHGAGLQNASWTNFNALGQAQSLTSPTPGAVVPAPSPVKRRP